MKYLKPAKPTERLLALLKSRNLVIANEDEARNYIKNLGYYRLTGYMFPFQDKKNNDKFYDDSPTFEDIISLYIFDRNLRALMMRAATRIEVSFRTNLSDGMCELTKNPFWYLDSSFFSTDDAEFKRLSFKIKESVHRQKNKALFLKHYYKNYSEPAMPPSWMMIETIPFGIASRLYKNLKPGYKKKIVKRFGENRLKLGYSDFESWAHSVAYLRNLCAHHSRLWNRTFSVTPAKPKGALYSKHMQRNKMTYCFAFICKQLMSEISIQSNWATEFVDFINENISKNPFINLQNMGFPDNWQDDW